MTDAILYKHDVKGLLVLDLSQIETELEALDKIIRDLETSLMTRNRFNTEQEHAILNQVRGARQILQWLMGQYDESLGPVSATALRDLKYWRNLLALETQ